MFTRSVLAAHCADPCQEVSKLIGSGKLGVTRTHARACLPVLSLLSPLLFCLSSSAFGAWQAACGKANHNLAHADVCIRDSDTALKSGNSPDPCCYSFKYGTQGRKAAQLCCRHTTMPCKWADFFCFAGTTEAYDTQRNRLVSAVIQWPGHACIVQMWALHACLDACRRSSQLPPGDSRQPSRQRAGGGPANAGSALGLCALSA